VLHAFLLSCATDLGPRVGDTASPSNSDPGPTGNPATVALGGECALADRVGRFTLESNPETGAVDGYVRDGVVPTDVLTEVAADGDCRLLRRENPFCDPLCAPDEACSLDAECVPYPSNLDVGTIAIAGAVQRISMNPTATRTYFDASLPTPAVEPGALVELSSDGAEALDLRGVGGEPVVLGEATWNLAAGTGLEVTWSPPTIEVQRTTVQLRVNVDQHGSTPQFLVCLFEDDGAGSVSASLLDSFLAAGVSGYPSGRLERFTADRQDVTGGCVDFVTRYAILAEEVTVDGHTPCKGTADCPPGHPCDLATETCL
jgi:hypothetical protein